MNKADKNTDTTPNAQDFPVLRDPLEAKTTLGNNQLRLSD